MDVRAGLLRKLINENSISEGKTLRKIYGSSCVNGGRIMKYKNEMYSLYKQPGIVKMIKID
jgi:hypothetical protein